MTAESPAASAASPVPLCRIPGPRGTTIAPVRLSEGSVSGIVHAPAVGTPVRVGIICPPIFYEHQLCHRTLRSLGERLAETGALVLRLDYRGTGDSSGDPEEAGPVSWREDVEIGAEFLRTELGHPPTFYLGLRVGATVALKAAIAAGGSGAPAPAVIAWAPIFDGGAYAEQLERTHATWFDRYARQHRTSADASSGAGRVLGHPWPDAARERLESLGPPSAGACEGPVTLVETEGYGLSTTHRAALDAAAPRLTVLHVAGPAPWAHDPDLVSPPVPARSLEMIVRTISAGAA